MRTITFILLTLLLFCAAKCNDQALEKRISDFSNSVIQQLIKQYKKEVAVLNFCNSNGEVTALTQHFTEVFVKNISTKMTVSDSAEIKNQFYPEKLIVNGLINASFLQQLDLSKIDALLFAQIYDYGNSYSIELMIIDAVSFTYLGGEMIRVAKTVELVALNKQIIYQYPRIKK